MTNDPTGKELERLIAMLETLLAGTNAEIEAPSRRLLDKDTGKPREHDVLILWNHGHHRIITAVECRDRSRPVGVPDVEAFADKCAATGVHSAVMVSTTGFRKTARTKATARSITCMDLAEVESFDWLEMEAVVGYLREFSHIEARIEIKDGHPVALAGVFDANGNEISEQQIRWLIINNVPATDDPEKEVGKDLPVRMRILTEGWTARDQEGASFEIDHIRVVTSFKTVKSVRALQKHRYSGGDKDYAFASADWALGNRPGKFVMVRNDDDSTSICWMPDKYGC